MANMADKILNACGLTELLDEIDAFCRESYLEEMEAECMQLKEELEYKTDSDIHILLCSYLSICEDGDEVIEALYEFMANCRGFAEATKQETQQVTKEEFEAVLDECEDKCAVKSCIEKEHILNMIQIPMVNENYGITMRIRHDNINLFVPQIDTNEDKTRYIAEEIGAMVYDVIKNKVNPETIVQEMNRYIPETRETEESVRELFKRHFYSVVMYKEIKPGIYPKFDSNAQYRLEMEFYKKIIIEYLRE